MKLNRKWLNEEFVDLSHVSDKEYVEKLTVFGQKVETWERMDAEMWDRSTNSSWSHFLFSFMIYPSFRTDSGTARRYRRSDAGR